MSKKRTRRGKSRLPEESVEVEITAMSNEGRGIGHVDNRIVFIDQALIGERVLSPHRPSARIPSADRRTPF